MNDEMTFRQALECFRGVTLVGGEQRIDFDHQPYDDPYTGLIVCPPARFADYTFKAQYQCSRETWAEFKAFLTSYMEKGVVRQIAVSDTPNGVTVTIDGYAGRRHLNPVTSRPAKKDLQA